MTMPAGVPAPRRKTESGLRAAAQKHGNNIQASASAYVESIWGNFELLNALFAMRAEDARHDLRTEAELHAQAVLRALLGVSEVGGDMGVASNGRLANASASFHKPIEIPEAAGHMPAASNGQDAPAQQSQEHPLPSAIEPAVESNRGGRGRMDGASNGQKHAAPPVSEQSGGEGGPVRGSSDGQYPPAPSSPHSTPHAKWRTAPPKIGRETRSQKPAHARFGPDKMDTFAATAMVRVTTIFQTRMLSNGLIPGKATYERLFELDRAMATDLKIKIADRMTVRHLCAAAGPNVDRKLTPEQVLSVETFEAAFSKAQEDARATV